MVVTVYGGREVFEILSIDRDQPQVISHSMRVLGSVSFRKGQAGLPVCTAAINLSDVSSVLPTVTIFCDFVKRK